MENLTIEETTQLDQDKNNWQQGGGYLRELEGITNKTEEMGRGISNIEKTVQTIKKEDEVFVEMNRAFVSFLNECFKILGGK